MVKRMTEDRRDGAGERRDPIFDRRENLDDRRGASECDFHQSGVCALHGESFERIGGTHKAYDKSIRGLERAMREMADKLPGITRATYALITVASLVGVIITGAFIYTRDTGAQSVERDNQITAQQAVLTAQIRELAISSAKNEGLQTALLKEMREFTSAVRADMGKLPMSN